jgi:hypothetical protein
VIEAGQGISRRSNRKNYLRGCNITTFKATLNILSLSHFVLNFFRDMFGKNGVVKLTSGGFGLGLEI